LILFLRSRVTDWPLWLAEFSDADGERGLGEVVNLRRRRKAKARDEKSVLSAENRARSGRTLAAKKKEKTIHSKLERDLEGHRIESGEGA
jgi:uncharacterized protein DUF4169